MSVTPIIPIKDPFVQRSDSQSVALLRSGKIFKKRSPMAGCHISVDMILKVMMGPFSSHLWLPWCMWPHKPKRVGPKHWTKFPKQTELWIKRNLSFFCGHFVKAMVNWLKEQSEWAPCGSWTPSIRVTTLMSNLVFLVCVNAGMERPLITIELYH